MFDMGGFYQTGTTYSVAEKHKSREEVHRILGCTPHVVLDNFKMILFLPHTLFCILKVSIQPNFTPNILDCHSEILVALSLAKYFSLEVLLNFFPASLFVKYKAQICVFPGLGVR